MNRKVCGRLFGVSTASVNMDANVAKNGARTDSKTQNITRIIGVGGNADTPAADSSSVGSSVEVELKDQSLPPRSQHDESKRMHSVSQTCTEFLR